MKLSDKQIRFCEEYLVDYNGTQAAIRAGYSKKTANEQSTRLLAKVHISEYLQKKKNKVIDKLELSRETVLEGYRKLAFYDIRKFYDADGNILNVNSLDDETAFALVAFEVMEERTGQQVVLGYTKKIKTSDRKAALDSICKVLGFNAPDKIENKNVNYNTTDLSPEQIKAYNKVLEDEY